jgi:nuclear polyadenylated RNA-binding protein NAB2
MNTVPEHSKPTQQPTPTPAPCRYGAGCTRQGSGCPFQHPTATPCRFGTGCTKANCTFSHPPGRVLPNTFIRGIDGNKAVTITAPQTGSIGTQGMNKSLKFSDADKAASAAAAARADLEKKMRDLEERKKAAAVKKDEAVPTAA